jgi:ATP-binding cassette subfamily B (MDR/TAP) protein 1
LILKVELEDEIDEPKEIEPPPAAMPFSRLFAYADKLDWALLFVGSLAAVAHGTALVVYLHYFAKMIHILSLGPPKYESDFRSWWIVKGGKK